MKAKVLLIDDDQSFVDMMDLLLRGDQVEVVSARMGAEGIQRFKQNLHGFALVIIDYCLPDLKGSEVATTLRKINSAQEFLFTTGHEKPDYLIDLLETGAGRGFLFKGRPTDELRSRILAAVADYRNMRRLIGLDSDEISRLELDLSQEGMIGRSPAMKPVLDAIRRFRAEPYSVLIVGETGTGKELIAKALAKKDQRVVVVDCPRYSKSENLMESDLFGYVKGAFTGAEKDTPGLLSQAHGQVLFLDELHQLSIEAQAKLLRFLQEMKYRRVGDHSGREISVQFKLVAAAKPEIFDLVRDGGFLEDLLHRVGRLEIRVPSLKERPEDIELLVRATQEEFNRGKTVSQQKQIRISTVAQMMKHPWTGNVRQLQNAVLRMMAMASGDVVNPSDFDAYLASQGLPAQTAVATSLNEAADQMEAEQVTRALRQSRTKTEAATRLGITRWTLNRIIDRLGIIPEAHLQSS